MYRHQPLYDAYKRYFGLVWDNYKDQGAFHEAVTAAHNDTANPLNYVPNANTDSHFSTYFFPIPRISNNFSDGWDTTYNPIAKHTDRYKNIATGYFKMNMYHFKGDKFGGKFISTVSDITKKWQKIAY